MHPEGHVLRLIAGIAEVIDAGKIHLVRAVPKQPLLGVTQPQRRVRAGLLERQCDPGLLLHRADGGRSVFRRGDLLLRNNLVTGGGRRLLLRRSPSRRYAAFQLLVAGIRAVKKSTAKNGPSYRSTHHDETDCSDALNHFSLTPELKDSFPAANPFSRNQFIMSSTLYNKVRSETCVECGLWFFPTPVPLEC